MELKIDLRIPRVLGPQLVYWKKHWPRGVWVSQSAQTATPKYHGLGGLNTRHLFLTVLEVGKSKIKVPANVVSGGAIFLAYRQPPSDCILTW